MEGRARVFCFLVAFAIVLHYLDRQRRVPAVPFTLVLLLVTVGSLARYNSVLAAIPLVQFLFIAGSRSDAGWWRAWRSIALASTVTIVLFVAGHAALTNWLRPEKVYHASRVYLFDLIGTSRQAHVNLVPGRWTEEERREMVTTCYAPRSFDFTWLKCDWVLQRVQDAGQWRQLPRHWRRAVQSHPLAYAAHRLAYVGTFFMKAHLVFNAEVTRESIDYGFTGNVIFRSISTAILGIAATRPWTMFFTQGFWFLASPVVFLLHLFYRGRHPAATYPGLVASAAAALYTAPLAVVGLTHDFRYVYRGIGGCCLACTFALDGWWSARAQPVDADNTSPAIVATSLPTARHAVSPGDSMPAA